MRIRLHHRFGTPFDTDEIMQDVVSQGISYEACYDAIMRYMARDSGKSYWGDYAQAAWRHIPYFLNVFPNGKAWHICRDPRGVISSWRKITFQQDGLYLNFIFNWIDSVNHIKKLRQSLPADKYHVMRFEDIHREPEKTMVDLCAFLGVEFEETLIQSHKWETLFDKRFVEANVSSHTKEKVYGFDVSRIETWKQNIEDWEVALIEFLAGEQMDYMGYERAAKTVNLSDLHYGVDLMCKHPLLLKNLTAYLATGEGTSEGTNDPTDPRNWGVPDSAGRFTDTPAYEQYQADLAAVEERIAVACGS